MLSGGTDEISGGSSIGEAAGRLAKEGGTVR